MNDENNLIMKYLIWKIAPVIMVLPSLVLRMKDKHNRKPIGDTIAVYSEGVAFILFLIYMLRHIIPSQYDYNVISGSDVKEKKKYNSSIIVDYLVKLKKKGDKEKFIKIILYSSALIFFLILYMLVVISDFIYQLEAHTVFNEDSIQMFKALMEGNQNNKLESISSLPISHPLCLSILVPLSVIVTTLFFGLLIFARDYNGPSMIRSCSQQQQSQQINTSTITSTSKQENPLYWSTIFFLTAISLVVTTGSWSPCAHLFVLNCKVVMMNDKIQESNNIAMNYNNMNNQNEAYETNIHVQSQAMLQYKEKKLRPPNVIFMVNDSLSGYALNSPAARQNMPFFRKTLAKHDGFVEFKNSRATSSLTACAMSAILSGIVPIDLESGPVVRRAQVGRRFQLAGYDTAVFSPVKLHFENYPWRVLSDNKRNGFNTAVDIESLGAKVVNCCSAMDDRIIIDEVEKWLDTQQHHHHQAKAQAGKEQPPFMMLLFTNHLHPHYIVPKSNDNNIRKGNNGPKMRYLESLKIHDQIIQRVFTKLQQINQMENTVLVSVSDHGEMPKDMASRATGGAPALLNNAMWAFVGRDAMIDEDHFRHTMGNLRQNSHKLVSAYDALPTLMSLAGVPQQDLFTEYERENFVHGESLALGVLPENRVVYGWQGKPFSPINVFGAIFQNDEAYIFSNDNQEITGLVHFPPQSEEEPIEDPFPELTTSHEALLGIRIERYRNLLDMAPLNYQKVVKSVYGKLF